MNEDFLNKELFKKYYKPLCYFAWEMVNDTDLAEDLVQDAFISYWSKKDEVSSDENSIKSFLYTSIRNAVYNLNRRDKVIQKYFRRNHNLDIDDVDYEHKIITAEFFAELHRVVSSLPASCQQIFNLSYMDGLSNQEIADQLLISINTIKTQKQRALKVIRQKINPELLAIFVALFFC